MIGEIKNAEFVLMDERGHQLCFISIDITACTYF
jgi:hypothetical protein